MNLNLWSNMTGKERYFIEQLYKPKESTKEVFNIFKKFKLNNLNTLDLACGNGANLFFLKKRYNNNKYCLGLDFNKKLIKQGLKNNIFENLELKYGDIYKLNKNLTNKFQLITSFQILSWMKDYKEPSSQMIKLNSDYIFVSSLFWEGLIDFEIKVNHLKNNSYKRNIVNYNYCNIYSLNNFLNFYKKYKYKKIFCEKFDIKKKLKNNFKRKMGTYTLKTKNKNIQISGPLIMNWYFIIFKKTF